MPSSIILFPNFLLLVKSAGNSVPNATLAAPVKVAKSIIKSVLLSVS